MESLSMLSNEQRAVLAMRYLDGQSVEETAEALGLQPSAVRSRQQRGLRRMRALLDGKHNGDRRAWAALLVHRRPVASMLSGWGLLALVSVGAAIALALGLSLWRSGPSSTAPGPGLDQVSGAAGHRPQEPPGLAAARGSTGERQPQANSTAPSDTGTPPEEAIHPFPLANGSMMLVRVRAIGPLGQRLEGAGIWTTTFRSGSRAERVGETDAAGEAEFEIPLDRRWVFVDAPGFARSHAVFAGNRPGGSNEPLLMEMRLTDRGGRVAGVVMDADGRPLAGAQVKLLESRSPTYFRETTGRMARPLSAPPEITDPKGAFDFGYQSPFVWKRATLVVNGSAGNAATLQVVPLKENVPGEPLQTRLDPSSPLTVRLIDPTGLPVNGGETWIEYDWKVRSESIECASGSSVQFPIAGKRARWVHAEASDGRKGSAALTPEGIESGVVEVSVAPMEVLEILAQDADGLPLEGWRVDVLRPRSARMDPLLSLAAGPQDPIRLVTDADGRAELRDVVPQGARAYLFAPESTSEIASASALVAESGTGPTTLVAKATPEGEVIGRLSDPRPRGHAGPIVVARHKNVPHLLIPEIDAKTGTFRIDGLTAGRLQLSVLWAGGVEPSVLFLDLSPKQKIDVGNLQPTLGYPLRVEMRRADGLPIEDPTIELTWFGRQIVSSSLWSRNGILVDGAGIASLPPIVAAGHAIECRNVDGSQYACAIVQKEDIDEGLLIVELEHAVPVQIKASQQASSPSIGMHTLRLEQVMDEGAPPRIMFQRRTVLNRRGAFAVRTTLPPGRYQMTATGPSNRRVRGRFVVTEAAAGTLKVPLEPVR